MISWESLNTNQQQAIQAALDLVNGGQDMEETLFCYRTITQYVINSTYNKPTTNNEL